MEALIWQLFQNPPQQVLFCTSFHKWFKNYFLTGQQVTERTDEYLMNFHWNEAQYPINRSSKQLIQSITEVIFILRDFVLG